MFYFYNLKNLNTLKNRIYTPIYFLQNYTKYYFRVILNLNKSIIDNYEYSVFNQNNIKSVGYSFIINKTRYLNNLNRFINFNYLKYLSINKDYLKNFYKMLSINQKTFIIIKPKRSGFKIYNSGIIGFLSKVQLKYILRLLSKTKVICIIKNKFLVIQFCTSFFKLNVKIYNLKKFVKRILKKKKRNVASLRFFFSISVNNFKLN